MDYDLMTVEQLKDSINELTGTLSELKTALNNKLTDNKLTKSKKQERTKWLKELFSYSDLPPSIEDYFIKNANLNDLDKYVETTPIYCRNQIILHYMTNNLPIDYLTQYIVCSANKNKLIKQ